MTAFNTKGYGLELTIGFIKSAITSCGILETGEFIFAALNSVVIGRLMATKLCKSNFQECLPSIARDESRGKQIKISLVSIPAADGLNKTRTGGFRMDL